MITVNGEVFLTRKETGDSIKISVKTLEVWRSVGRNPLLHKSFFKLKGVTAYYKLSDIGEFLKQWNPEFYYEHYERISREFTDDVAKAKQR